MKHVDLTVRQRRWRTATVAAALALVAGCGGDDEPRVTIFRVLLGRPLIEDFTAPGASIYGEAQFIDLGAVEDFPAPGASIYDEARLNELGVRTSNKRCASASGYVSGELVIYLGFPPSYVLFDIPVSDLAKAQSLYYRVYEDGYQALSKPFVDCATWGY